MADSCELTTIVDVDAQRWELRIVTTDRTVDRTVYTTCVICEQGKRLGLGLRCGLCHKLSLSG